MNRISFSINISSEEYLKSYQHHQAVVFVMSDDGRRVKFPANLLKRFIMHNGIQGRFSIEFDAAGKCLGVERL
jgi:glucose-6-phosphate isomerase